eukprot:7433085-Pyramimonas_sp.AAC.1
MTGSGTVRGAASIPQLRRLGATLQPTAQDGCARRLRARTAASGTSSHGATLGQPSPLRVPTPTLFCFNSRARTFLGALWTLGVWARVWTGHDMGICFEIQL